MYIGYISIFPLSESISLYNEGNDSIINSFTILSLLFGKQFWQVGLASVDRKCRGLLLSIGTSRTVKLVRDRRDLGVVGLTCLHHSICLKINFVLFHAKFFIWLIKESCLAGSLSRSSTVFPGIHLSLITWVIANFTIVSLLFWIKLALGLRKVLLLSYMSRCRFGFNAIVGHFSPSLWIQSFLWEHYIQFNADGNASIISCQCIV